MPTQMTSNEEWEKELLRIIGQAETYDLMTYRTVEFIRTLLHSQKERVVEMIEKMWLDLEGYSPIQQDEITNYVCKKLDVYQNRSESDLKTKIEEEL